MKIGKFFYVGLSLALARLFGKHKPLFVSWQITQRCNLRCKYCDYWNGREEDELTTEEIKSIIDELAYLGTMAISFTGGEPLIRDDIGEIIAYAKTRGIIVKINSNGYLVPQKINQIKDIDQVNLSFDGPEPIHDEVRGSGSYRALVKAIEVLKQNKKKITFHSTLADCKVSYIDFILDKCGEWDIGIFFQPATELFLLKRDSNPYSPSKESYNKAMLYLLEKKKEGNKYIFNSTSGIKHLSYWPNPRRMYCSAGRIIFRINAQGELYHCDRFPQRNRFSCREKGFGIALNRVKSVSCGECWCGPLVELNLAMNFNFNAIINIFRVV